MRKFIVDFWFAQFDVFGRPEMRIKSMSEWANNADHAEASARARLSPQRFSSRLAGVYFA